MLDFNSGSYAGRMQPPGRPNMISTFSISRERMRASAPVITSLLDIRGFLLFGAVRALIVPTWRQKNEKTTPNQVVFYLIDEFCTRFFLNATPNLLEK
jgi:hypothetical protein